MWCSAPDADDIRHNVRCPVVLCFLHSCSPAIHDRWCHRPPSPIFPVPSLVAVGLSDDATIALCAAIRIDFLTFARTRRPNTLPVLRCTRHGPPVPARLRGSRHLLPFLLTTISARLFYDLTAPNVPPSGHFQWTRNKNTNNKRSVVNQNRTLMLKDEN